MGNIIIVNKPKDFPADIPGVEVITAKDYLDNETYRERKGLKVFNLCRSFAYQSIGYYVSLLAAARGHRVIPDITTIQDTKTQAIIRLKSEELDDLPQKSLAHAEGDAYELYVYFGKCAEKQFQALSQRLFQLFNAPLLCAYFSKRHGKWYLQDVDPVSGKDVPPQEQEVFRQAAIQYFEGKKQAMPRQPAFRYDLAILHNPSEKAAPSNPLALKKFIKAAASLGIRADLITKDAYNQLAAYDALFIRETTCVSHHTYRFARKAAVEGLVVIDDPESILKCSNKVYLAELLARHDIPRPRTLVVHKDTAKEALHRFSFPFILKLPDSYFSLGVVKVNNEMELSEKLAEMFCKSDLVIAQEYLPTPFDWRIGIMDRKPIYACKYYMARNHWQIVNWGKKGSFHEGASDTILIEDAPPLIVEAALQAANLIGDGFYGVDLKEIDGKPYVIEINDNPSIDAGVEDEVLKDGLYMQIMRAILHRLEKKRALKV